MSYDLQTMVSSKPTNVKGIIKVHGKRFDSHKTCAGYKNSVLCSLNEEIFVQQIKKEKLPDSFQSANFESWLMV